MNKSFAALVVLALSVSQAVAVPEWGQCDGIDYTGASTQI
jgi:hypothetical protein